jgi:dephospho-CoA kinase
MSEFTANQNIERFEEQLRLSRDEAQKATLRQLLKDERCALADLIADRSSLSSA